jgi:hypothetical protein
MISQKAIDLIVAAEVSSRAYYEKALRHPEWPGGASGVTIGIGYDLGYATADKVRKDWGSRVPQHMLAALLDCVGAKGPQAKLVLPHDRMIIDIPWQAAMDVFMQTDIPEFTAKACRAINGADKLSPDCLGALVSLTYNRGVSFDNPDERHTEMRAIKRHIESGELDKVPGDFRAMKHLWPDMKGLQTRREAEAKLWEGGLVNMDNPMPKTAPALVGTAVAGTMHASGVPPLATIIIAVIASLVVGVVIASYSAPVLARAKG